VEREERGGQSEIKSKKDVLFGHIDQFCWVFFGVLWLEAIGNINWCSCTFKSIGFGFCHVVGHNSCADVARFYWRRLSGGPYMGNSRLCLSVIFFFNGFTEMKVERLAINGKVLIMAGRE
jgi:hypothetical protein